MSLGAIYNELRGALSTKIPADQHPAPAFAKISKHFDTLEAAKVKIPALIEGLICLYALPSRYENIAQMLVQATSADNMGIGAVREAVTTAWDQSQGKKPEKLGAHKISAVKRKPGDPSFSSQQQQRPQGSSSNARDGKRCPYRGKRAGKKRQGQNHDHHHAHDVLIASTVSLPPPTIAHVLDIAPTGSKTRTVKEQGPFHPPPSADTSHYNNKRIKKAFKLARDLDISPTEEDIKVLDALVGQVDPDPDIDMEDADSVASSRASERARFEGVARADDAADSDHDDNQSIDWGSDKDQGETVSLGDKEDLDRTIAEAAGFDQNAFIDEHYSAA
ncbi:hypothetical protein GLOTRDRAFT_134611 [Gloeophyllum trabeum ATCC 11539]|uniref:Uncharacterized protein n=1 Tax=Gloeophyllum trabeum (strain ATCC 11539 / FP-39264 / Madison 617) TaxID=670483 RepID=S7PQY5_GLOTA|nr:uncharacterized protein GLOTRDRAFT_134611 [Gloeophyllum trabeum ATCC 11539]EPQ49787.1 hypothetical protein GLOTRDRAFT_134611 [Gloeophyllum trabeum ATCC 11539]